MFSHENHPKVSSVVSPTNMLVDGGAGLNMFPSTSSIRCKCP